MPGFGITDNSADLNGLAVNTDHEAAVALTQTATSSGFACVASEKGVVPGVGGERRVLEMELSEDYQVRTALDTTLFAFEPLGTVLNGSIMVSNLSGSQTVTVAGGRLELNSSGLVTASSGSLVKTCRTFGKLRANALYFETAVSWSTDPVLNWFAEWGGFAASSAVAAVTDGVFFRITAGEFRGYMVNNSVESYVNLGALPEAGKVHNCVIEMATRRVNFWVNNVLANTIEVPTSQFSPIGVEQVPWCARTYCAAVAPALAIKLQVASVQVSNGGADLNRLWPTFQAGQGNGCYQAPTGVATGQTANWTNNTAVTAVTPVNGAALFLTLGGQFSINAPVAADNVDLNVMSYQVPAGKTLVIRGVRVECANIGAVVATTAHLLQWGLGVGSTANTLAGTESLIGVKIRRVIPLGMQAFPVGAAIGALASPVDVNLDAPVIVHGGEWVSLALKVLVGTATGSQVLRGLLMVNGYFE